MSFAFTIYRGYYHYKGHINTRIFRVSGQIQSVTVGEFDHDFDGLLKDSANSMYQYIFSVIDANRAYLHDIRGLIKSYRGYVKGFFAGFPNDGPHQIRSYGTVQAAFDITAFWRFPVKEKVPALERKPSQPASNLGYVSPLWGPIRSSLKRKPRKQRRRPLMKDQPRTGSPMSNHYRLYNGILYIRTRNGYGAPLVTTSNLQKEHTDWLYGVVTSKGDFKHPTYQRFSHELEYTYHGLSSSLIVYGGSYGQKEGPNQGSLVMPFRVNIPYPNSSVYNRAVAQIYDALRGDIDVSIDLAESHKTKQMMKDTFRSAFHLWETFHKMRRSNPRDWGNLWLEYTYGWKPLVSTIYQAGKKLMIGTEAERDFVKKTRSSDNNHLTYLNDQETCYGFPFLEHAEVSDRCIIEVRYALTGSRLLQLAGFTSLNPVSIAWELTPYSFVVDWFVNFGGYLRDFESALLYNSSFVQGYATETQRIAFTGKAYGQGYTGTGLSTTLQSYALEANLVKTNKRRTVLTISPFPRPPRFDPKLGSTRLLSAASLLGQQLDSLKHPSKKVDPRVWDRSRGKEFIWTPESLQGHIR